MKTPPKRTIFRGALEAEKFMRKITYAEAINEALRDAMLLDDSVIAYGLGINDPKRIFGTTKGLVEKFGKDRVFDMPTSESAMTGIGVGAALGGLKPVMIHQRFDFFLYAMDSLVNGAAKWYRMFGGKRSVPICIRLVVGHGWGQGPTHSQSFHSWLAHVPGLKVVMPVTPADAKGLLLQAIFDSNPVVIIEHRWLHNALGEVAEGDCRVPIGKARIARTGKDLTIVALSYMVVEALRAAKVLQGAGVDVEVVDLRSVRPIDTKCIIESCRRTGRIIALDIASPVSSLASEVIAIASEACYGDLKAPPVRIAQPDLSAPTSFGLTKGFYRGARFIAEEVAKMFGITIDTAALQSDTPHDVPGDWFKGPF